MKRDGYWANPKNAYANKGEAWWYANKGRWPSFTTVCLRPLGWSGLLKMAKETYGQGEPSVIIFAGDPRPPVAQNG